MDHDLDSFDRRLIHHTIGLVRGVYYGRNDPEAMKNEALAAASLRDAGPHDIARIVPSVLRQLMLDTRFEGAPRPDNYLALVPDSFRRMGFPEWAVEAAIAPGGDGLPVRVNGRDYSPSASAPLHRPAPGVDETKGFIQGIYRNKKDRSGRDSWHHPLRVWMRGAPNAPEWFLNALINHDVIEDTKPGPKADPYLARHPVTPYDLFGMGYDSRTVWMVHAMSRLDRELSYPEYIQKLIHGDFGMIEGKTIPEDIHTEVTHGAILGKLLDNRENRSKFRLKRLSPEAAERLEQKWKDTSAILEKEVGQLPPHLRQMVMEMLGESRLPRLSSHAGEPTQTQMEDAYFACIESQRENEAGMTRTSPLSPAGFRRRGSDEEERVQFGYESDRSQVR